MQKQEQMQQALRYNNAVRYPVLLYQNVFLLLYVVVDLVISSLLFSRERAEQSTHFISLESFKSLLQHF